MGEVLTILIIFGAIFGGGILKVVFSHREKVKSMELEAAQNGHSEEKAQMQRQIELLTERVEVLEKIVTDKKYQLDKEIASL